MDQTKKREKEYNEYIKQVTPTHNVGLNMVKAFICGGLVCLLGQFLQSWLVSTGMTKPDAASWTTLILVGTAIILTGFNLFGKLVKFGGAGFLVPITGFANSVVAPAIEYKKEGQVFGIGVKIFTISGPVILYGLFTSWLLGVIGLLLSMFEIYMGGIV